MIRINVEITVSEQKRAKVLDNILRLAEKSRKETGCAGYEIFENSTRPESLLILETWERTPRLWQHTSKRNTSPLWFRLHTRTRRKWKSRNFRSEKNDAKRSAAGIL
ncbi:MAG: antibiotic biosynthesis monooxygenase [Alistipes putredinis]|nr:MAG: antibiotic biosynthesis monooxygenase [Alistipes putredinis]